MIVQGGYTRLIKSRIRFADSAPMTFVRFTGEELSESSKKEVSAELAETKTVEEQVKAGVEEEIAAAQDEAEAVTEVADESEAQEKEEEEK